jgi:hypothetical protein
VLKAPLSIVNAEGKTLLRVTESQSDPVLCMYDAEGNVSVMISSREGGGRVTVCRGDGKPLATLIAGKDGGFVGANSRTTSGNAVLVGGNHGGGLFVTDRDGDEVFTKP